MKNYFLLALTIVMTVTACKKNDDSILNPSIPAADTEADVAVQDFMYRAMNAWYYWQADVPDLVDGKFETTETYTEFLASEADPASFFDNKLKYSSDRFSFYDEDYTNLTNSLSGISRSHGMEFGLVYTDSSQTTIYGYVQYILPNSNAATKDIKRGDLFLGVNGTPLTASNYQSLLYGESDTYTLNMADYLDDEVVLNDKTISLTKEESFQENPIFLEKVFEMGDKKIGYLVYNSFLNEYDAELNDVFSHFKTAGITDLVLDLRYNPGGSVNTTRLLASMIYDTNSKNVFLKARYNAKYQKALEDKDIDVQDYFADKLTDGTAINTVNLNKIYVLATYNSASASELLINGLRPYIDVVHIGKATRGKNEFSVTMVDNSGNDYIYSQSTKNDINPDNKWAIQPIIGRNENADGFSDYTDGLQPDIELDQDLENLGVLGDAGEPMLAKAIAEITQSGKRDFTVKAPLKSFTNSKMALPVQDNMYVDKLPLVEGAFNLSFEE